MPHSSEYEALAPRPPGSAGFQAAVPDHSLLAMSVYNSVPAPAPGGWCDVDISVEENTIKEVKEESGLDVTVKRVIAVQDREKHNLPIYAYKVCKIFMQCEATGGQFKTNIETTGFDYFGIDELPELAEEKNNKEQIAMCFNAMQSEKWEALFD